MSSDRIIKLVQLQDLELMIREAQDPARKGNEEALGFMMGNIGKLEAELQDLRGQIDKQDLRAYDRIHRRYNRVIVPAIGRICTGCFQELPTSVKHALAEGAPLPTCESCGRILYWA